MTYPEDTFDFEEDELRQSSMSRVSSLAFACSYLVSEGSFMKINKYSITNCATNMASLLSQVN